MIACTKCGHDNEDSYIVCEKCERMLRPDAGRGGGAKRVVVRLARENGLSLVLALVALVALVLWLALRN